MTLTPEEGFGIGTEVELTAPAPDYVLNDMNPVKGGMYSCVGSINSIIDAYNVGVRWENGTTNSYRIRELSYAENSQKYNSIW